MKKKSVSKRKQDHLVLTEKSQGLTLTHDLRFDYSPLLAVHPPHTSDNFGPILLAGKKLKAPFWFSSMTGGTGKAKKINYNLAKVAGKLKLGMGVGSCRPVLEALSRRLPLKSIHQKMPEFFLRKVLGDETPFFANIGIAQLTLEWQKNKAKLINEMVDSLEADGLIIHINPIQEWLQPEGDRFTITPWQVLSQFVPQCKYPVIVKEVGQGFGPGDIERLSGLPLSALELSGFGGTNFALLEWQRGGKKRNLTDDFPWCSVGHTATQMVDSIIEWEKKNQANYPCPLFIVSGGMKSFLDGHYHLDRLGWRGLIGQAASLLPYASESAEALEDYMAHQIQNLALAKTILKATQSK